MGQNTETIGSSSAKQMHQINLIKITLLLPATMHVLKSWPCLLPASEPDELIAALEPQASTCSKYQHVGPNLHVVFIRYASWTELVSRAAYCDIHTMQLASVSNKCQHRWAGPGEIQSKSCCFLLQHCMFRARGHVSCQPELIAALDPQAPLPSTYKSISLTPRLHQSITRLSTTACS